MKIAALIQAHHKPQNLDRLLQRLSGPLWRPFIHLDAKSDEQTFSARARDLMLGTRLRVAWGGRSGVDASLLLMRAALKDEAVCHLYLMSGQCFPVKTDDQIRGFLAGLPLGGANLMTIEAMPVWHKPLSRLTRWVFNDLRPPRLGRLLTRVARLAPPRRVDRLLHGLAPYGGATWWLFDRAAAERILAYLDANPWYLQAFKWTLLPDEMLFQTLVMALEIPVAGPCPTFTKWVGDDAHPQTVTAEIYAEARAGQGLFARKFDSFYPDDAAASWNVS